MKNYTGVVEAKPERRFVAHREILWGKAYYVKTFQSYFRSEPKYKTLHATVELIGPASVDRHVVTNCFVQSQIIKCERSRNAKRESSEMTDDCFGIQNEKIERLEKCRVDEVK